MQSNKQRTIERFFVHKLIGRNHRCNKIQKELPARNEAPRISLREGRDSGVNSIDIDSDVEIIMKFRRKAVRRRYANRKRRLTHI